MSLGKHLPDNNLNATESAVDPGYRMAKSDTKDEVDEELHKKDKKLPYMDVRTNGTAFMRDCAHEYAKLKAKDPKLPKTDPAVQKYYDDFKQKIVEKVPDVKQTKISKTGAVDNLTDTKNYTGASKERFDGAGRGLGIKGRTDVHANTGFTGQYKGEGTYGKK
ncbi:hypothetical protein ScPMuIL_003871 [Solemya velum]